MPLDDNIGRCLASQHIRSRIREKRIIADLDESRIQPSSFDPIISDEVYILDTEEAVFMPAEGEQVYRTLLQLPARQRSRVIIRDSFEIKKGFTYLFRLEEKVRLAKGEHMRSSPKSSFGRLFVNTRLLSDYNHSFDKVVPIGEDLPLDLWLLVQPLAFNSIVRPGLSLNQLRLFTGYGAKLGAGELIKACGMYPILQTQEEGRLIPVPLPALEDISDDSDVLPIHLNLSGKTTGGIVGLRARRNPEPIDTSLKAHYEAERYFEPILASEKGLLNRRGEHYLLSTAEVFSVPPHLNVELSRYSPSGFAGPLHFAGFIDNGFNGDVVLEVRSDEISDMILRDGMKIGQVEVFRTDLPDKLYGAAIGSNYQLQTGPRPSKFFRPFDFDMAAHNYKKLNRQVLVQGARSLVDGLRGGLYSDGLKMIGGREEQLERLVQDGFFHSRYDCESDREALQLIPYVVIFGEDDDVFAYVRAKDMKDYGEERLFGKHSIGLGGHIVPSDAPEYVNNCINREVFHEEVEVQGISVAPKLIGTLMSSRNPVDYVHFGLVYALKAKEVRPKEDSIISGRMVKIDDLVADDDAIEKFESWSWLLISDLRKMQKYVLGS